MFGDFRVRFIIHFLWQLLTRFLQTFLLSNIKAAFVEVWPISICFRPAASKIIASDPYSELLQLFVNEHRQRGVLWTTTASLYSWYYPTSVCIEGGWCSMLNLRDLWLLLRCWIGMTWYCELIDDPILICQRLSNLIDDLATLPGDNHKCTVNRFLFRFRVYAGFMATIMGFDK